MRKVIHIRATRLGEQFNCQDKFIAWFDGEAAGAMAETPVAAVQKLLDETPGAWAWAGTERKVV